MNDDILNLEQTASYFGVSERTLIKLLQEEQLPARKIGREWRFSKQALSEWLGKGNSENYFRLNEQYRVDQDYDMPMMEIYSSIEESIVKLRNHGGKINILLKDVGDNVTLPESATLRVAYTKERGREKLTFRVFWEEGDK